MTASASATARWPGTGTPAIETLDPPSYRDEHALIAEMAQSMLASRRQRFPELVAAGKLDEAEATAEIALFEQIAAHWHWMLTGEGEPAPRITIVERCQALDRSLRTIAEIAGIRGGFDTELHHQAHCVIAMRWHADRANSDRMIRAASFVHENRRNHKEAARVA